MLSAVVGILGTAVLAIIGWAVNMTSRVNVLEKGKVDLILLINTKLDSIDEKMDIKFDATGQRLDRIERSMNGHLQRDYHG